MYKYLIDNKEVTRTVFKDNLAVILGDTEEIGNSGLGITIANYENAEKKIRAMQRTGVMTVYCGHGIYQVKKVNA